MPIVVNCAHTQIVPFGDLVPNPINPNKHPKKQIALLAKIIEKQGWRSPVVVSNLSGYIVKGHGRLQAAELLGKIDVPVDYQDYADADMEYADLVADNQIAELAEMDMEALKNILETLDSGEFDMDLTGFDSNDLADMMDAIGPMEDLYTNKITPPIYEPKTEAQPALETLQFGGKVDSLIERIDASEIPDDVARFLKIAAERHRVFDYRHIAEFYAWAEPEVQELFEQSALVIIDSQKAIEEGYLKLSTTLGELCPENDDLDS